MKIKEAFVLMPFSESLNEVYEFLIKGALENAKYKVKRADDIQSQNNILEDIIKGITESDLIVADLTDSNANVYYELGIAHALQKNVVLITQEINELPFDLKSYRVIGYSTHFTRMNEAKSELYQLALEASNGTLPFGNPVKDYGIIENIKVDKSFSKGNEDISDLGFLDHIVQVEENFERLTEIVNLVVNKLVNSLTPQIDKATGKINPNLSIKERRNIMNNLSQHINDYANILKPKNEEYRDLNINIRTSIEIILTQHHDYTKESIESLEKFLSGFEFLENGAQSGRNGFLEMLNSLKNIPNMEKNFNRASKELQRELELFIDNIDQTISMAGRAKILGKSLLSKIIDLK